MANRLKPAPWPTPPACPLGCPEAGVRPYFADDAHGLKRCLRCSVVFVWPRLPRAELEAAYSSSYFERKYNDLAKSGYVDPKRAEEKMQEYLRRAGALAGLDGPGTLLDVGCGTGSFLAFAADRGWKVEGIELSPHAACAAQRRVGAPIHAGGLSEVHLPQKHFDVVTLLDVLEHLEYPLAALASCARALRPGGVVLVATPNFQGLGRKLVGRNAFGLWPEEHLVYFSPETLRRALLAAGLAQAQMVSRSVYPENAAMLLGRWRGREQKISRLPSGNEREVRAVKTAFRNSRLLKLARGFADRLFTHALWGDELVVFAVRTA